jgi:transcriptional regulator with XRE-family HTH domain
VTRDPGTVATELGDFLRTRRARLTPEQVGVASYGARRVPGLRREELAQLAGISPTYYMRLEQGQSVNASASVIDALARALRLDADEHAHLADLAGPARAHRKSRPARPERPRPTLLRVLSALADAPAVLMDRRTGVLAWNPLGHALLASHYAYEQPGRLNLTRLLFLDPHTRELYRDWYGEACRAVASLRLVAARGLEDPLLTELVGDLTVRSTRFARIWAVHPVRTCVTGTKQFQHPLVGELELGFEVLHAGDDTGQRLLICTAAPGGRDEAGLRLLASTLTEPATSGAAF